ncbi:hypothetical protein [Pseudomonas moorei]|uniref:hypothetical protein n=1 Tax=Pseudomonas moorei TaxID=395599 RepID=UPI001FF2E370|nr:hypothetical protein [Pseudomonas moorei]
MQYWIDAIFSLKSIIQITPALLGIFCLWFWARAWQGLLAPNGRNRTLENTYFFKSSRYRKLFGLHQSFFVKGITFTLAVWSVLIFMTILPPILNGYYPVRMLAWWALPALFVLSTVLFYIMGNQGLAIKLDKRLSLSWDKDNVFSIHLNHRRIRSLSQGFIRSIVGDVVLYRKKVRTLGIDTPLNIESWLLAPDASRHNQEIKKFHNAINYSWLKNISPSLKTGHIKWMMKRRINHRKVLGKSTIKTAGPLRIFTWLRAIIFVEKHLAIFVALLWLSAISGLIYFRLRRLQLPELKGGHKMQNGELATKLICDAEAALIGLKVPQAFVLLPLKRMSTFSVIVLVAYTPRVAIKLGGWVGGMKLAAAEHRVSCSSEEAEFFGDNQMSEVRC